jgi:hypothetical protein
MIPVGEPGCTSAFNFSRNFCFALSLEVLSALITAIVNLASLLGAGGMGLRYSGACAIIFSVVRYLKII